DKLSPVACGPMVLPSQITFAPYQSWSISFLCEGAMASQSIDDILIEGQFVENGANSRIVSSDVLTVVKIEIATKLPLDTFPHRHQWGVGEEFYCTWCPMLSLTTETNCGCVKNSTYSSQQDFTCPFHSSESIVNMVFRGQTYCPITRVIEPQAIEARNAEHLEFEVDVGRPGGVGFQMDLHILPGHVSFTALDFVEVPSNDSTIEGYFTNRVFSGMWYHTVERGAGERHRIQSENFWFTDLATMGDELILPCSNGRLVWNIPIEWMSHEDEGVNTHRIGTIPQTFTMDSDGTLRVSKYQFWIERLLNGTLRMSEGMR
ncbi:MAG: hypothetical protein MJ249_10085, partial [Kiritimatiellae bacterium]|nr:hypothetical protein [Kiritimatiellia bacterium]